MHTRAIVYCLALLALLGSATFVILRSSGQVANRASRALERWVRVPVTIEGAEHPLFADLRLDRVVVPAAPVLGERVLAVLRDIEVRGGAVDVAAAELTFEREAAPALASERGRWNCADVLRDASARVALREAGEVRIGALEVTARRLGSRRSATEWRLALEDVVVRLGSEAGAQSAIEAVARVRSGDGWKAGRIDATWREGDEIELRAEFEGVAESHVWLPLVSDDARALWARLRPRGEVDVTLERVRIAGGTVRDVTGILTAYGLTLDVEGLGTALQGVRGTLRLSTSGVGLGGASDEVKPRARIAGIDAELTGTLADGGGTIELALPPQRVERFAPGRSATAPSTCARVLAALTPRGQLEGRLVLTLPRPTQTAGREGDPSLSPVLDGTVRLAGLVLEHLPFVGEINGTLALEHSGADGSATLSLDGTRLPRAGRLAGEVRARWSDASLEIRAADLEVLGDDGMSGSLALECRFPLGEEDAPNDGEATRTSEENDGEDASEPRKAAGGSPAGRLELGSAPLARPLGKLEWLDLSVATGLGTLRGLRGALVLGGDADASVGEARIASATIAAGLLGQSAETIELERGEARFRLGARGVILDRGTFRGTARDLRCRGEVRFDGTLDLVCVLAPAALESFRAEALDSATLEEWRLAGGERVEVYLVDGTIERPSARAIDADHPVFAAPRKAAATPENAAPRDE